MQAPVRILIVGCGHMGRSHAHAYQSMAGVEISGLVGRRHEPCEALAEDLGINVPIYNDFEKALEEVDCQAVAINTYVDTHAPYAIAALNAGKHVFVEKPISETVEEAERVVAAAQVNNKKLVIGYILRHHSSWVKFVEIAQTLGKPLVMRMNLNQQSTGESWQTHKNIMESMSPIVDCGVHYVDVMCQMTESMPISVNAVYANLSSEISPQQSNYGHFQVRFADNSIGWYEAGWGPMMSETATFVKDVIGPNGSVSITAEPSKSDDIDSHTKTDGLLVHHAKLDESGKFEKPDDYLTMAEELNHDELCAVEQTYFINSIKNDIDLASHWRDAVSSLKVVLAADESARTGRTVLLKEDTATAGK